MSYINHFSDEPEEEETENTDEVVNVVKALQDTQKACEATSKKCSDLHGDMKSINENLSSLNNKLFVFMTHSGEIESDVRDKMDNFMDDVEKARTEAQSARESMSDAMADVVADAQEMQKAFSEMPSMDDYMNKMRVYIGETVKSISNSEKELRAVNREIWHERMKIALKWAGVALAFALVLTIIIVFLPPFLKLSVRYIFNHAWTEVIFEIGFVILVIYIVHKIGEAVEWHHEKNRWK